MIKYLKEDEWSIIEEGFDPKHHPSSESIFSIGNGRFGQRANFEEDYSGPSLQGSYVAGIYYPDKTRVGWWKNGYPEYFAKVLNSCNWIGINVRIDGENIDLFQNPVEEFRRELNMKEGFLSREFTVSLDSGKRLKIKSIRLCSLSDDETAAIRYSITALNFSGAIEIESYLDADVRNEDANYDELFWDQESWSSAENAGTLLTRTRKTDFWVGFSMINHLDSDSAHSHESQSGRASSLYRLNLKENQTASLCKYIGICSSLMHETVKVGDASLDAANRASKRGFDNILTEQSSSWAEIWKESDIQIKGDRAAQQAIRFNIFQLNQTFTGKDDRLNIGPKGFTGEKYGGSTYWDTEAYCLPMYLSTRDPKIARQLLVYRFRHLQKAIENAEKLGFKNGAALYPMVTMNGEECHNEWEITFEEIHRNGAIAFAIFNYVRHTGDEAYLAEYGFDVLLGIARFWAQRVNWSEDKSAFVMLGVTGPNEYENNVNNNFYTNYIARWCLKYTLEALQYLKSYHSDRLKEKMDLYSFDLQETIHWENVIDKMYFPKSGDLFLQQDGFLDKELRSCSEIPDSERPINQYWSWDRILRSPFIKQADTLQTMYFFEEEFTDEEIKTHFDFYEPLTVHESSLSPCVHSILAAKIGYREKAYEMYLRTSRLDIDDYNHEVHEGLHITSMGGTWMSVVEGFGGMRVKNEQLHFNPMIPDQWSSYSFQTLFRGQSVRAEIDQESIQIHNLSDAEIKVYLYGTEFAIRPNDKVECEIQ